MELSVFESWLKPIVTSDRRILGRFVNLVINKSTFKAGLLVFPHLPPKLITERTGKIASFGSRLFGRFLKKPLKEVGDFAGDLVDFQDDIVGPIVGTVEIRDAEIRSRYYIIPANQVEKLGVKSLILKLDLRGCLAHKNIDAYKDAEITFFEDDFHKEHQRFISISLKIESLRGKMLYDPERTSAKIIDAIYETDEGRACRIEIEWTTPKKLLDTKFMSLEYDQENQRTSFRYSERF